MIALITAILGVAKPILDEVYFNTVTQYLREYEDVLKQIQEELLHYPNIDDAKVGVLKKEKIRLEGALALQAGILQVKANG